MYKFEEDAGWEVYYKVETIQEETINWPPIVKNVFDTSKFKALLMRSFLSLLSYCMVALTFACIGLASSKLNSGIFSALFASSIIFSCFMFYIFYGQTISYHTAIGIICIISCVALISLDSGSEVGNDEAESGNYFFHLAILSALMTGFIFALNLLQMNAML